MTGKACGSKKGSGSTSKGSKMGKESSGGKKGK